MLFSKNILQFVEPLVRMVLANTCNHLYGLQEFIAFLGGFA